MGFFSQKKLFFRRNWNKWFFLKFDKNREKKFDYPKTEKKLVSYKSVKKSGKI